MGVHCFFLLTAVWNVGSQAGCATFLVLTRQTIVKKHASARTLGSDLARVDAHVVKPAEYKELPELTDDLLGRAVVKKVGRSQIRKPATTYFLALACGCCF